MDWQQLAIVQEHDICTDSQTYMHMSYAKQHSPHRGYVDVVLDWDPRGHKARVWTDVCAWFYLFRTTHILLCMTCSAMQVGYIAQVLNQFLFFILD